MGFNATVVVMNDALQEISEDPDFGKRLAKAVAELSGQAIYKPVNVAAHGKTCIMGNAAVVIETHHSSYDVLVKVGGNTGEVIEGGRG